MAAMGAAPVATRAAGRRLEFRQEPSHTSSDWLRDIGSAKDGRPRRWCTPRPAGARSGGSRRSPPTAAWSPRRSPGDAGEMLDERAKTAYRRRLVEIEEDIEQARALGDARRE